MRNIPYFFYAAAICVALYGCHLADAKKEIPAVLPELGSGALSVVLNPGSYPGWLQIIGGISALVGAGVGGKVGYNKVRKFLGKPTDDTPDLPGAP